MNKLKQIGFFGLLALAAIGFQGCTSGDIIEPADIAELAAPEAPKKDVSPAQAEKIATLFSADRFNINPAVASRSSQTIETITATDGTPLAYVVNTNGAGWAIVSAVRTYYPIIAYSDDPTATFSLSDDAVTQSGLAVWMSEIKQAIATSESIDSITALYIADEWLKYEPETAAVWPLPPGGNSEQAIACRNRMKYLNDTYYKDGWLFYSLPSVPSNKIPAALINNLADSHSSPREYTIVGVKDATRNVKVDALTKTIWSQHGGYNDLCPNKRAAGCVPVAMGQIMKYYQHPKDYIWSDMLDDQPTYATKKLLADIGEKISVKLGSNGQVSSNIDDAKDGFEKFKYNATKKNHSQEEVLNDIINNKRVVYMRGSKILNGTELEDDGHAWVCDGASYEKPSTNYYIEYITSDNTYSNYYETSLSYPETHSQNYKYNVMYHYNIGWGGSYNNWYAEPIIGSVNYTGSRQNLYVSPK